MAKRLPASKVILGLAGVMTLWSGVALANDDLAALSEYAPIPITNRRGEHVGEARAAFNLNIHNQR